MHITKIQIYADFWTLHTLLRDICLHTYISSVYHCFFLKWWLQPQPWSSILSHPAVNCNSWNSYRKMKSFAKLYEHQCQNSCYPREDWNGQKWCNQIGPDRSILHLPVLHAFYSHNEGQLKILDNQANKPGNPTLPYSCRKCLPDNNHFQSSPQKQHWSDGPHHAAMPHSGDLPHIRGLSDRRFADLCQPQKCCPMATYEPSLLQLPAALPRRRASRGSASTHLSSASSRPACPSPRPSPRTGQLALPTHSQHQQLLQMKPRKKAKKSTSFSICQMSRDKKKKIQTESNVTSGAMQSILQILEHNRKKWVKKMEWDLSVLVREDK